MRPRYYWYGPVKRMIREYPYTEPLSKQEENYMRAIDKVYSRLSESVDGELKQHAIDEILLRQTKTVNGVAIDVCFSERTVQRWVNKFVCDVGREVGF